MHTPCKDCPDRKRNEDGVTICQNSSSCEKWAGFERDKALRKKKEQENQLYKGYLFSGKSSRKGLKRSKYGKGF